MRVDCCERDGARRPVREWATLVALAAGLTCGDWVAAQQLTADVIRARDGGIERRIPPPGRAPTKATRDRLEDRLARLRERLQPHAPASKGDQSSLAADVDILIKAVAFALRHNEFYSKDDSDIRLADQLLDLAEQRLGELDRGEAAWARSRGRVVRGYYSRVDHSPQPYGLEIPEDWNPARPAPLIVFLHGRGDKTTDLHFISQRLRRAGPIQLPGAIVLHPFGRQCIGFKSAGEIDVLEAIDDVARRYHIDQDRVALLGFSMGGAGAWHIGAHYADRFAFVGPGAGFAETARYNRLKTENYPPDYEQRLWRCYDVPNYVRNLFHTQVVAYSGELDKQIQAARVMEQAFRDEDRRLEHLIGPGVGHKYEPATKAMLIQRLGEALRSGRRSQPATISLQTSTLRYSRVHWLEALGLERHWSDARVDASVDGDRLVVRTRNVRRFQCRPPTPPRVVQIDGARVETIGQGKTLRFVRSDGDWRLETSDPRGLAKRPGLQGPIDDAFLDAFVVVGPSEPGQSSAVDAWVARELEHFVARWAALFRGDLPVRSASRCEVDDLRGRNVVLWGDARSNRWIAESLKQWKGEPLAWDREQVRIGAAAFPASDHVPVLVFPSPWDGDRYVVLNSGPTFREAHDRTNSLQNPKLPDWSILRIGPTDRSDSQAGAVRAAGFFTESWGVSLPAN